MSARTIRWPALGWQPGVALYGEPLAATPSPAPAPAPSPSPSPSPSPAPSPGPAPAPAPATYLLIDFENGVEGAAVSTATAPGVTMSGSATIGSANNFAPVPADVGLPGGSYFAVGDGPPFVITVDDPAASRFQRLRFLYVGAIEVRVYGTLGSNVLVARIGGPDWFDYGSWIQALSGLEYIQRIEVIRNGTTSFGLFGLDNIELSSTP